MRFYLDEDVRDRPSIASVEYIGRVHLSSASVGNRSGLARNGSVLPCINFALLRSCSARPCINFALVRDGSASPSIDSVLYQRSYLFVRFFASRLKGQCPLATSI